MPATRWRVFLTFLAVLIPAASPLSFNITPIAFSDRDRFNVSGAAVVDAEGIRITPNMEEFAVGRATYSQPLHLWDVSSTNLTDFSTHFSYAIDSDGDTEYGDGMAFFLVPLNSTLQDWSYGGGLGLGVGGATNTSSTSAPSYPFVAVEFDTYLNIFERTEAAFAPHVGIDISSMISANQTPWRNDITQGFQSDAWISYNATTLMLTVEFTGRNGSVTQRGSLGYEVDLRAYLPEFVAVGFSAGTGRISEHHVINSWSFSSTLQLNQSHPNEENNNKGLVYGLSVGSSLLFLGLSGFAFFLMRKRKRKSKKKTKQGVEKGSIDSSIDSELQESTGPRRFSYQELIVATNNFTVKLGEGGFGCVYKGFLAATITSIAVKKVSEGSKQGQKEFAAEVKIISQLRHINLVQLIGWCHEGSKLLLVYEFMSNGSLESHLFKHHSVLTWETRLRVAQGLASALLYLHEELVQYVVHRDIKASNIMLDSEYNTKLGDFGLARLVDCDKHSKTTVAAGTVGYMAPEYPATGRASKKTDVYSFGIVLLEIVCGRKTIDYGACENQVMLVEWVWSLYGDGQLLDAIDQKLEPSEDDAHKIERLIIVGLWCAHPDSTQRPSMKQVMQVLDFDQHHTLPDLPSTMPARPVLHETRNSNHSSRFTTISADSVSDFLPR